MDSTSMGGGARLSASVTTLRILSYSIVFYRHAAIIIIITAIVLIADTISIDKQRIYYCRRRTRPPI